MINPASSWVRVNSATLGPWQEAAKFFSSIGTTQAIEKAAETAGEVIVTEVKTIVGTEDELSDYKDTADSFQSYVSGNDVFVGVPEGDSHEKDAEKLQSLYPVLAVAFSENQDAITKQFEQALRSA